MAHSGLGAVSFAGTRIAACADVDLMARRRGPKCPGDALTAVRACWWAGTAGTG